MLSRLFIAAVWSPAGKGLTSLLLFVMFNCVFVTFPCGILGQVWYMIVSVPDPFRLSYFKPWPHFHMTFSVDGTLNTNTATVSGLGPPWLDPRVLSMPRSRDFRQGEASTVIFCQLIT